MTENRCVVCGDVIPEGTQVCPKCNADKPKNRVKALLDDTGLTKSDILVGVVLNAIVCIMILTLVIGAYTTGYYLGSKSVDTAEVIVETTETVSEPTDPFTEPETTEPETEPETEPIVEVTEPTTIPYSEIVLSEPGTASSWSDRELLACVIFQEAGADLQCDECRRRVADVVLNRVNDARYPDTIYEVLMQKQQYGNFYWTGVKWADRAYYDCNRHAVERAFRIADEVLNGQHSALYGQKYIGQAEFIPGYDWIECCGIYYGK